MASVKVRRIEKKEVEVPDLGSLIQEARENAGKSVSQVCREMNLSRTYWYLLENGKEEAIAEETLRRIEELLGVDFNVRF